MSVVLQYKAHPLFAGQPLVIASHNEGKVAEIRELIEPLFIAVKSAADLAIDEPEETGKTFTENAELKARHAMKACGLPALADDSGLVIPALGGSPGIYSARWAGPNKDFNIAFARIEKELAGKVENVAAYFIAVLALCLPSGEMHHFEGKIDGKLHFPPRGEKGFGYDPIFVPEGYNITFAEFDPAEKNRISHRARAFRQFMNFLQTNR
jgi:XTP/dITP diphosphohydrolase